MRAPSSDSVDKPRVAYWNNQPSPYFVRRMNALQDRGLIAIEAWFSEFRAEDRDWSVDPEQWRFSSRMLPGGPRRALRAIKLLRQVAPDVFVTLYGDYAFATAVLAAKVTRTPVVIHAMKTFASWRGRSTARELAKHSLFRIADAVHVPGPDAKAYAESYGTSFSRIFTIREELDLPFWTRVSKSHEPDREASPCAQLSGCIFLYVGRLWRGKGIDSLIEAYRRLRTNFVDCSLVLVGSGKDEEYFRGRTEELGGVLFAGFAENDALKAWYSAADVFVFPTLGDPHGHVVQEAMASSLPVIATTAAGDITDRVVEGTTGFLVPPGEPGSLADRMELLAHDVDLRHRLGTNGRERIQDWSTEQWAERFEEMIFEVAALRAAK